MTETFWESDEPESQDDFWADDEDEERGPPPPTDGVEVLAPVAEEPAVATEPMPDPLALHELRQRESVLMALKDCLGS